MTVMDLKEGASTLNEIQLLDAKLESLDEEVERTTDQLRENKKEIEKRLGLETANLKLEETLKLQKKEYKDTKAEVDKRVASMTSGGWTVPIKKRSNGARGTVSM